MAIQVFDDFLREFEAPITHFVSDSVTNLTAAVAGPLRVGLMLYIVLYGIAILRGAVREPVLDFAWRSVRLVAIVTLATNADTFQAYVTTLFNDTLPREIGNSIAGAGLNMSSGRPFDQLLNKGISVATQIYEQSGLTNIAPALIAAILMVFTAAAGFLQFAVMLYAKVGLSLVVALGPIFVALALFEATRPFAEAWTRQLVNFVVLQVLVIALIGLMLTTVGQFVDKYGTNATTGGELIVGAVAISAVLGLAAYVALQLPEIAGALAGGASLAGRTMSRALTAVAMTGGTAAAFGAFAGSRAAAGRAVSAVRKGRAGGTIERR
ncbi:type IV secretion system protein [Methylorubrum sp. SB2]|uniref:type IV secretion system protein n=1 Tax=Methylorubrum subtropicum TaxID=3138812 RepID=UPI00313B5E93